MISEPIEKKKRDENMKKKSKIIKKYEQSKNLEKKDIIQKIKKDAENLLKSKILPIKDEDNNNMTEDKNYDRNKYLCFDYYIYQSKGISQLFELFSDAFGRDRLEHEAARSGAPCVKRIPAVGSQIYDVGVWVDFEQFAAHTKPAYRSHFDVKESE